MRSVGRDEAQVAEAHVELLEEHRHELLVAHLLALEQLQADTSESAPGFRSVVMSLTSSSTSSVSSSPMRDTFSSGESGRSVL